MKKQLPACAICRVKRDRRACRVEGGEGEKFCPTKNEPDVIEKAKIVYQDKTTGEFARQASIQEAECYANRDAKPFVKHPVKPRILEICEFAEKMGYRRLGLAYCGGIQKEASEINRILESYGFEVVSVSCKVGCVPKEFLGVKDEQKVKIGNPEPMCNPVAQAGILNETETDFNVAAGLCVGHDSLFFQNAKAPTTVFAVKDRVFGHNPMAAIYTLGNYSGWLLK